jgi:hypothetical protein
VGRLEDSQSATSNSGIPGGGRERAHVEVVRTSGATRGPELGRRLAHLRASHAGGTPVAAARRDRERDVAHLAALLDQTRRRAAAAELAVVGVRRGRARFQVVIIARA